jgi:hemoglobin
VSAPPVRRDIADSEDISLLVAEFYRRAFADDLLGPVFVDIARVDLSAHLPVMCDFWETVLLRAELYRRNALRPHVVLDAEVKLTPTHFARWLALWAATVDERHAGKKAELAKVQATRIAGSISRRLRGQPARELPGPGPRRHPSLPDPGRDPAQPPCGPKAGEAASTAGRAWGAHLISRPAPFHEVTRGDAISRLVAMLDDLDFAPEVATGDPDLPVRVRLRHCPFLELAEDHGDLVCPLHLGLMQGALTELHAPIAATALEPFAEAGACLVHLTPNHLSRAVEGPCPSARTPAVRILPAITTGGSSSSLWLPGLTRSALQAEIARVEEHAHLFHLYRDTI